MKIEGVKRGISPVVASVLLVALVLVLASIVFIWSKGFLSEQIEKGDRPIESLCNEIDFSLSLDRKGDGIYDIEVVNRGNLPLYGFTVVATLGGDESRKSFNLGVDVQKSVSDTIDLGVGGTDPDKVTFYPTLLGNIVGESTNRPYTCTEKSYTETL